MTPRVLIVGAGIAGCCAAIALARIGWAVTLIEKQSAWQFQSSGIFVYSNGLAQFRALGVMDEMVTAGFPIADGRNVYLNPDGSPFLETFYPARFEGNEQVPILGIRRADMHRVLSRHLGELGVELRLGCTVEQLDNLPARVDAQLSDGSRIVCDLLLGADGIRSRVRQLLWPDIEPRYSGFGVWRSVHQRPADLADKIMMMAPGLRLGIMPISQSQLYLFGTVPEPAGAWFAREDWADLMRSRFSVFRGPAAQFLDQLTAQSEVLYTAVEEVVMAGPWHHHRVLLIGDAAHASTPFMGQGGAMAVQDAVVLGRLLASGLPLDSALARFSEARPPICRFVQEVSRQVGVSGAQSDPLEHARILDAMRSTAQQRVDDFYAQLERLHR
jgi:2-polyprenyl-6-methoxyphenol hydroxylase-like FAD-dependent oxidoreductase